jgi:hypothetical protein
VCLRSNEVCRKNVRSNLQFSHSYDEGRAVNRQPGFSSGTRSEEFAFVKTSPVWQASFFYCAAGLPVMKI